MSNEPKHTPGPWNWTIHDKSMATLHGPDEMSDAVMSISPCGNCSARRDVFEWGSCYLPNATDAEFIRAAPETAAEFARVKLKLAALEQSHSEGNLARLTAARMEAEDENTRLLQEHTALMSDYAAANSERNFLAMENTELESEIDRLKAQNEELLAALRVIYSDDCGCSPVCQCNSEANLKTWKEDTRELCRSLINF